MFSIFIKNAGPFLKGWLVNQVTLKYTCICIIYVFLNFKILPVLLFLRKLLGLSMEFKDNSEKIMIPRLHAH